MKKRSNRLFAALLSLVAFVAGCGGGDDGRIPVACSTATLTPGSFDQGFQGGEGDGTGAGADGSGDAGDAGGNGGDAGGNEGQFRNVRVEVRNRQMELVAAGLVDNNTGMVNLKLDRSCKGEPIEIKFVGGPGGEYYDEVTGRFEPYPAGKQLRVRLSSFARNVSANAYTEAAARLMDAEAGGETLELDPAKIDTANQRIAALAKDQLPGIYREPTGAPVGAKGAEINRITKPLNPQTIAQPGSYADNANGRLAAALAGLGGAGNTAGTTTDRPASRINEFFAADMADGKLDLQGVAPGGTQPLVQLRTDASGAVVVSEAIPYTYETLWRAKSSKAGTVAVAAGDDALRANTQQAAIADYRNTLRSVYRVTIQNPPASEPPNFVTATDASQAVKLFADGRLALFRSMAAGFSASIWWNTDSRAREVTIAGPEGRTFGDVKVGSRADVMALTQDRSRLLYVKPFELYIVRGNEDPLNQGANEALLQAANDRIESVTVQPPAAVSQYRILGFAPGPARRAYPGRTPPAFLMLMSNGTLWGVDPAQPTQPFAMPIPEPMVQVAFDRMVAPTYVAPGYGTGGAPTPVRTAGDAGNRRLFGLTTRGTVKTWIEGLAGAGQELAIPGKVVLLASESKTHVYALTSDGNVYWINADQALGNEPSAVIDATTSLAGYNRRYALHQIVQVDLGGKRACWIARSEAVICDSGEVRKWTESINTILFAEQAGQPATDQILMPNNIGSSTVAAAGGYWRINAAEEEFLVTDTASRFSLGTSYLPISGAPLDAGAAQGKRNIGQQLLPFPDEPRSAQGVEGRQLVAAIRDLFRPGGPALVPRTLVSALAWDSGSHRLEVTMANTASTRYSIALRVDGGQDPYLPTVTMDLEATSQGESVSLRGVALTGADAETVSAQGALPSGGVLTLPATANYRIHRFMRFWEDAYRLPVHSGPPKPYIAFILRDVASDPYAFRLCFDFGYQVRRPVAELNAAGGGQLCSVHESDGRFREWVDNEGYSLYNQNQSRAPDGQRREIDWGVFVYSPF